MADRGGVQAGHDQGAAGTVLQQGAAPAQGTGQVGLAIEPGPAPTWPWAAAASALEVSALAGPQPAGSTTQLIVRHLARRSLVVVLDNCEHVIGEAAALADTLVGADRARAVRPGFGADGRAGDVVEDIGRRLGDALGT